MANKKPELVFKQFAHALGDGDLNFLCSRLHYRYQDDFAEALNYLDTLKMDENESIYYAIKYKCNKIFSFILENSDEIKYDVLLFT